MRCMLMYVCMYPQVCIVHCIYSYYTSPVARRFSFLEPTWPARCPSTAAHRVCSLQVGIYRQLAGSHTYSSHIISHIIHICLLPGQCVYNRAYAHIDSQYVGRILLYLPTMTRREVECLLTYFPVYINIIVILYIYVYRVHTMCNYYSMSAGYTYIHTYIHA